MQRRLGVHVSIAGGIDRGLERARDLGCTSIQMFSHNPRSWNLATRDAREIERFRSLQVELDIRPVFIHTSYLINLASPRKDLLARSTDMVAQELYIAEQIDAAYVVLHTGSAAGDDPVAARIRAAAALTSIADSGVPRMKLLLENTAGERGDITSRLSDLAGIMERVPAGLIAGICLDTCHAYAAGYDIGSSEGVQQLADEVARYCGREHLRLIHLNDAKKPRGSGVDRHEHIGRGAIGGGGLRRFVNHPFFAGIPLILETPKESDEDDLRNLAAVREYFRQGDF